MLLPWGVLRNLFIPWVHLFISYHSMRCEVLMKINLEYDAFGFIVTIAFPNKWKDWLDAYCWNMFDVAWMRNVCNFKTRQTGQSHILISDSVKCLACEECWGSEGIHQFKNNGLRLTCWNSSRKTSLSAYLNGSHVCWSKTVAADRIIIYDKPTDRTLCCCPI